MPKAIITLTTDFGEKDHFVGAVKGAIYSEMETIKIVDISHSISPFHISEAAYIIQNAYKNFPSGSIHIIGIDSELNPENKHIAVYLDEHYFICANNGIISMLTSQINPGKIVEIKTSVGEKVKAGDSVIVIEAMKMENEIQAAISGTVIAVNISKGDEVSPNETLVEIQP